jgi:hypothetical protein
MLIKYSLLTEQRVLANSLVYKTNKKATFFRKVARI